MRLSKYQSVTPVTPELIKLNSLHICAPMSKILVAGRQRGGQETRRRGGGRGEGWELRVLRSQESYIKH